MEVKRLRGYDYFFNTNNQQPSTINQQPSTDNQELKNEISRNIHKKANPDYRTLYDTYIGWYLGLQLHGV